jgi:DNA-binding CsgD family transcriptional regulator
MLIYDNERPVQFITTELVHLQTRRFMQDVWKDNSRITFFRKNPFSGFVVAHDYFTPDFLQTDNAYSDRTAIGLDSQIGTIIPMPTGEIIVYAFDRWKAAGLHSKADVEAMNALHPHLCRSSLISARLGQEKAVAITRGLQALGLPAAILSASARLLATNPLFDAIDALFMPAAFNRLAINDIVADRLFRQMLEAGRRDGDTPPVQSLPIARQADRPPCVLHLIPLRRNVRDVFPGGDWLVAVTSLGRFQAAPPADILVGLFDLTPAEARFAGALAGGLTLKEAAHSLSITEKSGRTYLGRIFAKTGIGRQAELVSLLRSAHPFT